MQARNVRLPGLHAPMCQEAWERRFYCAKAVDHEAAACQIGGGEAGADAPATSADTPARHVSPVGGSGIPELPRRAGEYAGAGNVPSGMCAPLAGGLAPS